MHTSYNFPCTMSTPEVCIGVVQAQGFHPIQHYEDLCILEQVEDLKFAFVNPTGQSKSIDCIWVDGAADEGPSHLEIQYLWTEWHWKKKNLLLLWPLGVVVVAIWIKWSCKMVVCPEGIPTSLYPLLLMELVWTRQQGKSVKKRWRTYRLLLTHMLVV